MRPLRHRFGRRRRAPEPGPPSDLIEERLDDLAVLTAQTLARCRAGQAVRDLHEAEFRVFSQFGDDGIIDYLIERLGVPRAFERFVEIGVEDYREANTRFLLVNRNWSGLIVDRTDAHVRRLRGTSLMWRHDLHAVTELVDRDNVADLLQRHGFAENLGLLSIDVDGNDYWIWEAVSAEPLIVVVEYNSLFGADRAVTSPYERGFDRARAHFSNLYWGASLKALALLGERKGYRLVGANSAGNNVYFVRRDRSNGLPTPTVADCYVESRYRESRDEAGNLTYLGGRERVREIASLPVWDVEREELCRVGDLFADEGG